MTPEIPDDPARETAPQATTPTAPPAPSVRVLKSEDIFQGQHLVCISHAGSIYRLQITARGKLILQK